MLIACKYQEIYPPNLNDLVFMTDNAYSSGDVLQMETLVLSELEFSITFPTPLSFVETYMRALNVTDLPTELLTRFLLDMSLIELAMQRYAPSTLAMAALLVTWRRLPMMEVFKEMGLGPTHHAMHMLVGSEMLKVNEVSVNRPVSFEVDVFACAHEMERLLPVVMAGMLNALRNKYAHPSFATIHPLIGLGLKTPPENRPRNEE